MPWFTIFETVTGKLISEGTSLPMKLPAGASSKQVNTENRKPSGQWNETTRVYEVKARTILKLREFLSRFTDAELHNFYQSTSSDVEPFHRWLVVMGAGELPVDLSSSALDNVMSDLVRANVITAARKTSILT